MKKLSLVVAGLLIVGTTSAFAAFAGGGAVGSGDNQIRDIGESQAGNVNVNGVINSTDVTGGSTVSGSSVGTKIKANGGEVEVRQVVNETYVDSSTVSGGSAVGMKLENAGEGGRVHVETAINRTKVNSGATVTNGSKVGMALESKGNQVDVTTTINRTDVEGGTVSGGNVGMVVD